MDGLTMRHVLRGEFTPGSVRAFLAIIMATIAVLLGISWICYEIYGSSESYNILVNQISDLGNPKNNPSGFYFFSLALWTLSFAAIPLLQFYRRVLPVLQAKVTGVFTILFALGIPGAVLVGFFPSSLNQVVHVVAAGFAFGGIGLAFFLSGCGLITSKVRDHNNRIPSTIAIASAAFIAFIITGFVVVGYTFTAGIFDDVEGTWLSFSLWEWLLLASICTMCAATSIPLTAQLRKTATK